MIEKGRQWQTLHVCGARFQTGLPHKAAVRVAASKALVRDWRRRLTARRHPETGRELERFAHATEPTKRSGSLGDQFL